MCGEAHSHKNCPNKEKRTSKCANCRGPHVANYKGCPAYNDQAFRQHVVHKQVSYASILKQASPPPPPPPPPPTTHLISLSNKLFRWSQTLSYKSLSHNCVPRTCLKSKYRQNLICQNRSQKQRKNSQGSILKARMCLSPSFQASFPSALCLQLHAGRKEESSSERFYGLKQGRTIISLIIIKLHQIHKNP